MAADNKTLGRFELTGIPPAMRGVPQIEVTFEIDENGIVSVTALDKGTNKKANIVITASSNLSESDIDKAVKEAEEFAEEDKKKKELIDMKNACEQLILAIDKSLVDSAEKLTDEDKETLKNASKEAKEDLKNAETIEDVQAITEKLSETSNPIFTKLYEDGGNSEGGDGGEGTQFDDGTTINVDPEDIQ